MKPHLILINENIVKQRPASDVLSVGLKTHNVPHIVINVRTHTHTHTLEQNPLGQNLPTLHRAARLHTNSHLLKQSLQDASAQDTRKSWERRAIRLELWASTMMMMLLMRCSRSVSLPLLYSSSSF